VAFVLHDVFALPFDPRRCSDRRRAGGAQGFGEKVVWFRSSRTLFAGRAAVAHVAIINGDVGIIVAPHDRLILVVCPGLRTGGSRILRAIAAPHDLARLDIGVLAGATGPMNLDSGPNDSH
jgi:hypothetical protein